jgi:hypothetical protein
MKKDKRTNNDLQNTTQKNKDQAIWISLKEDLEDTKGWSGAVYRRRTDNIQWQNENGQTIIYKTLHSKLTFEQDEPH